MNSSNDFLEEDYMHARLEKLSISLGEQHRDNNCENQPKKWIGINIAE
jgi:hypothetical protein